MKRLFFMAFILVAVASFVACSESKKVVSDEDWLIADTTVTDTTVADTDTIVTDETVTESDATGDKDDLFAEGPLSDDSPMVSDEDGELSDGPLSDEEFADEDAGVIPDVPPADVDIVPGTCADGLFRLTASVFYRVGNENITGGGTIAFAPVGVADSEGNLVCYASNTTVTMTLTVDAGQSFIEWRGPDAADVQGEFPTFTILMNADKTVRAQVTPPESVDVDVVAPDDDVVADTCPSGVYKLAPYVYYQQGPQRIVGGGEIAVNPMGSLSSAGNPVCYAPNTTVNMTVTVYEGYTWDQWRGTDAADVQGTFPNFWIVVDADKDVRARVIKN